MPMETKQKKFSLNNIGKLMQGHINHCPCYFQLTCKKSHMISFKIHLLLKSAMILLLLLLTFPVIAQNTITLKGTIVSESDRSPIIGATVLVKGTSIGTATDLNGEYTLNIPETAKIIEISYLGMTPISIPFKKDNINTFRFIEMRENSQ